MEAVFECFSNHHYLPATLPLSDPSSQTQSSFRFPPKHRTHHTSFCRPRCLRKCSSETVKASATTAERAAPFPAIIVVEDQTAPGAGGKHSNNNRSVRDRGSAVGSKDKDTGVGSTRSTVTREAADVPPPAPAYEQAVPALSTRRLVPVTPGTSAPSQQPLKPPDASALSKIDGPRTGAAPIRKLKVPDVFKNATKPAGVPVMIKSSSVPAKKWGVAGNGSASGATGYSASATGPSIAGGRVDPKSNSVSARAVTSSTSTSGSVTSNGRRDIAGDAGHKPSSSRYISSEPAEGAGNLPSSPRRRGNGAVEGQNRTGPRRLRIAVKAARSTSAEKQNVAVGLNEDKVANSDNNCLQGDQGEGGKLPTAASRHLVSSKVAIAGPKQSPAQDLGHETAATKASSLPKGANVDAGNVGVQAHGRSKTMTAAQGAWGRSGSWYEPRRERFMSQASVAASTYIQQVGEGFSDDDSSGDNDDDSASQISASQSTAHVRSNEVDLAKFADRYFEGVANIGGGGGSMPISGTGEETSASLGGGAASASNRRPAPGDRAGGDRAPISTRSAGVRKSYGGGRGDGRVERGDEGNSEDGADDKVSGVKTPGSRPKNGSIADKIAGFGGALRGGGGGSSYGVTGRSNGYRGVSSAGNSSMKSRSLVGIGNQVTLFSLVYTMGPPGFAAVILPCFGFLIAEVISVMLLINPCCVWF